MLFGYLAYILVLIFYVSLLNVQCAKILAIFPYPGPAQYLAAHALLKELALRGHNITLIVNNLEFIDLTLFNEIRLDFKNFDELIAANVQEKEHTQRHLLTHFHTNVTHMMLENLQVKAQIFAANAHFDMIIMDTLIPSALYALAPHFNAHLVGVSSSSSELQVDNLVGNDSPISFVPIFSSGITFVGTRTMNFGERLQNLGQAIMEWIWIYIREWSIQRGFYHKYFPQMEPTLREICQNFSLVLLNQHFSIDVARPYVPNMIEVGGMYISEKAPPLSKDLLNFINGAKHGVIYFSMGSNIKLRTFPADKFTALLDFLHGTKMRVLLKFESPKMHGWPGNVLIRKWFPQRSILAHSNVKLFITQGGYLSVMEAVYNAIPVVGIPVFYDHMLNMRRIQHFGMGVSVPFKQLSEENLSAAVEEVLSKEIYARNARKMQLRFNDRPTKPLETAVFWVEYILRHNGAEFMRVTAKDMNFIVYYNLDILGLFSVLLCVHIGMTAELWRRCFYFFGHFHKDIHERWERERLERRERLRLEIELQRQQRVLRYQAEQREEQQRQLNREREQAREEQQQRQQQQQQQQHGGIPQQHHRRRRRR